MLKWGEAPPYVVILSWPETPKGVSGQPFSLFVVVLLILSSPPNNKQAPRYARRLLIVVGARRGWRSFASLKPKVLAEKLRFSAVKRSFTA